MTAHDHFQFVTGCPRCDLSRDEEIRRLVTERQAKFNAATVIRRVAKRFNRHPATRLEMLRVADELRDEAAALLGVDQ